MPASLFIKNSLFSGKAHLPKAHFILFLPSPNLAHGRRQSEYLGNKEIEMGHQDAVSPRSPVGHYHILTIGDKLVQHPLTVFFCMSDTTTTAIGTVLEYWAARKRSGPYKARRPPRSHISSLTHRTRSRECCVSSCRPG